MADRARGLALVLVTLTACGDDGGGGSGTDAATTDAATGAAATASDGPTTGGPPTGATDAATEPGASTSTGDEPGTGDPGATTEAVDEPAGYFVAVGDGGRRARSPDGESWEVVVGSGLLDTDSDMAAPDGLRALAIGDGYLLAVGGGGNFFTGNAMVMRSTDGGASWQEDLLAGVADFPHHKLYGVAASGQTVVAAGMRGKRIRSEDGGLTWVDMPFEDTNSRLLGVAALATTFVIVGWTEDSYEAPKTSAILASADDGLTWGPVDESFARLDAIAAGNGAFVAIGGTQCLRSTDGVAWLPCDLLSAEFQGVSFTGGEFIVSSAEGLASSLDGEAWTVPVMPVAGPPDQLARGDGRWVGVRWTDRGWAEELNEWTFTNHATEPMRSIVFVPAP